MQKRGCIWLLVTGGIAAVGFVLFFMQDDTSATLPYDEYAYYLNMDSITLERDVSDFDKTRAFQRLLERIGRMEYGKSLGLVVSNEDITANLEKSRAITESTEYEQIIEKVLHEANISQKTYAKMIHQQMESRLMGELIEKQLRAQYGHLNDMMSSYMVNQYAVDYMETHFAEQIAAFRSDYQIERDTSLPETVLGVVGLVEGNMFYLIEDATFPDVKAMARDELLTTYFENEKGAWYPNVDELDVQVGDIMRVVSGGSSSNLEEKHRVAMNYGGAEIVQRADSPTAKISLTGQQEAQFTEQAESFEWEAMHVSMARLPDYVVIANGVTYSIWAKYNNSGMEIVRHDPNGYMKLTKSKAAPLYELLQ